MPHNDRRDRRRSERETIRREIAQREEAAPGELPACPKQAVLDLFAAVRKGQRGALGVAALHSSGIDVDSPVSIEQVPGLEARAGWGSQESWLTALAYAAKLGRDGCVAQLLHAGADATRRSCSDAHAAEKLYQLRPAVAALLSGWPAAYSVWVVRCVVAMREAGAAVLSTGVGSTSEDVRDDVGGDLATKEQLPSSRTLVCSLCGDAALPPMCWGPPCEHAFCEPCVWSGFLGQQDEDELTCPCKGCGAPRHDSARCREEKGAEQAQECGVEKSASAGGLAPSVEQTASSRAASSLQRWLALPESIEPHAKHKIRFSACSSLIAAHGLHVGLTRQQRTEELFKACEAGRLVRLRALIEAGVDLGATNEYGESALAVAAEAGHVSLVRTLCEAGADPAAPSNGGLYTPLRSAQCRGHSAVAQILRSYLHDRCSGSSEGLACGSVGCEALHEIGGDGSASGEEVENARCRCLIPLDAEHDGAGSWCIDGAFSAEALQRLDVIFDLLPDAAQREPKSTCSRRRYLHDVEGWACRRLTDAVAAAGVGGCGSQCSGSSSPVHVFKRMRFLDYTQPGGVLPAHTDLSRTSSEPDGSGGHGERTSTHTFILYLTSCDVGGETRLLAGKDGGVAADVEPRRGRLLLFPHRCWHEGLATVSVPKRLLRGEMLVDLAH